MESSVTRDQHLGCNQVVEKQLTYQERCTWGRRRFRNIIIVWRLHVIVPDQFLLLVKLSSHGLDLTKNTTLWWCAHTHTWTACYLLLGNADRERCCMDHQQIIVCLTFWVQCILPLLLLLAPVSLLCDLMERNKTHHERNKVWNQRERDTLCNITVKLFGIKSFSG